MDIQDIPLADLNAEIARRAAEANRPRPPRRQLDIDMRPVYKLVEDNMKSLAEKGETIKNFKQYLFEEVIEQMYGKSVWSWYVQHNKGGE